MQVSEAMTRDVRIASPDQTISEVARIMAECDVGSLPVGENDRLVGMITDRDITVRAVAQGCAPDTRVREVMTQDVKYCFEDEDIGSVAYNMGDIQVHRLPVVNRDKRLVGIVALADIANCEGARPAGQAVCGISTPSGQHGQPWQQTASGAAQHQLGAGSGHAKGGQQYQQQGDLANQQSLSGRGAQHQYHPHRTNRRDPRPTRIVPPEPNPARPATAGRAASSLDPAEQPHHQDDQQHEADDAAWGIAPRGAVRPGR